jgi:AAA ATPase-like protein
MSSAQEDSKFKNPSSSYWVGRPATIGEGFVGCEPKLQAIDDAFKSLKKVVVISGGAGTGKSRLAAEFSHRSGVPGFWTTAGGNCVQILTALAQSIDVPAGEATDEEIAVAVQRRLSDLSSETLWIVDNLDDLNQINELATAAGPVRLLITTRDARHHLLPPNAAFLEAYPLGQDPSIMLLCSRSKHDAGDPSL